MKVRGDGIAEVIEDDVDVDDGGIDLRKNLRGKIQDEIAVGVQ
jgi:hypothetical protein